jgi:hypothetical protein
LPWDLRECGQAQADQIFARHFDISIAGDHHRHFSYEAILKGKKGAAWLLSLGVRNIVIDESGRYDGTEPPLLTRCS